MRISLSNRHIMITDKTVHYLSEKKRLKHFQVPFEDFEVRKWIEAINGQFFSAYVYDNLMELKPDIKVEHSQYIYESIMCAYKKDMQFDIGQYIGKFIEDPDKYVDMFENDRKLFFETILSI